MDAYDGTMHFYVADPTEPIIRAWEGIFPSLFEPLDQMPAELQAHLRVPEELFNVQTRMYGQYHVTQPVTFFNNTDRWTVPTEQTNQQSLRARGLLRRDAHARRAEGGVPAAPADDRRAAGRT